MGTTILVDGPGTIGTPIAQFLLDPAVKGAFGIDEVIIRKFHPYPEHVETLSRFRQAGAKIAVDADKFSEFVEVSKLSAKPFEPDCSYRYALKQATIVIDCTEDGTGLRNKERHYLNHCDRTAAFIAQGSETNFGLPYAYGHNDEVLEKQTNERFIWIMSCNGHSILAALKTAFGSFKEMRRNLVKARFTFDRRGADVVNKKTVNTPHVGKPTHAYYGTHQAEDAMRLLRTIGIEKLDIHSRAKKLPSPFMHIMEVTLFVKELISTEEVIRRFKENILTSITYHDDIGGIYIEGGNWGKTGRINTQTILVANTVETPRPDEIQFTCVTPQDGNPLLSSIAAMACRLDPKNWRDKMKELFYPVLNQFRVI